MTDALANVDLFDKGADPFSPAALQRAIKNCAPGEVAGAVLRVEGDERAFHLVVEGEATPKLQGAILKLGKHMSIKANPKTRRYEDIVRQRATSVWNGRPLIRDTPVSMFVTFYREIPKSISKRDRAAALQGALRPITKPDCSNYVKAFEDGLKGVIFADDALIVTLHVEKHFSERPRVEVTLTW
jgi:Holliday junction resolvase RusA-like endonuclease